MYGTNLPPSSCVRDVQAVGGIAAPLQGDVTVEADVVAIFDAAISGSAGLMAW